MVTGFTMHNAVAIIDYPNQELVGSAANGSHGLTTKSAKNWRAAQINAWLPNNFHARFL